MKRLKRYSRNGLTVNEEEQLILKESKICVVGCGGLGGYTIEMLARIGIGTLKVIDGDVFDESNLNRQLFSTGDNLGKSKAIEAKKRVQVVNEEVKVIAIESFIDETNVMDLLKGIDVVVDAIDNIPSRKIIAEACRQLGAPFIYGAIAGWYGQVATIMPEDNTLDSIYPKDVVAGDEVKLGNPSFTPALVSSLQVSEAIKFLLSKGDLTTGGFIHIDLLSGEMEKVSFGA